MSTPILHRSFLPTLVVSFVLGMGWNLAVMLFGGSNLLDAFDLRMLAAGGLAGIAAGWCTVALSQQSTYSKRKRLTLTGFISAYFLGLFVYWLLPFAASQLPHLFSGRDGFDVMDGLKTLILYLYGTLLFGVALLPLSLVSQGLTLAVFNRTAADRQDSSVGQT